MIWYLAIVFGPLLAGIVLAWVWSRTGGRRRETLTGAAAGFAASAGIVVVLGELSLRTYGSLPILFDIPPSPAASAWLFDQQFVIPLVSGIAGLILLGLPIRRRQGSGSADLTPRDPLSFARRSWLILPATALVLTLAVALIAGAVSEQNPDTGFYDQYTVDAGAMAVTVHLYGWHYSVPVFLALAVTALLVWIDLVLIARPPLAEEREQDVRARTLRTRNVLAGATGSLLLHLGVVCVSLAGTASMRGGMTTADGPMAMWSPMAALEPVFRVSGILATVFGIALWATVALTALPARRLAPLPVAA